MNPNEPDEITQHITRHLGPPLPDAIREIIGYIRIQVVPPGEGRPYLTLVTTGMSECTMTAPAGYEDHRHIELFMHLPPDWPLTKGSWRDPNCGWPIEWMRLIAHYPESSPVFLASEQTVGNSPPEPFAPNTQFSCMMLLQEPGPFGRLRLKDGRTVRFYMLVPLFEEERVFKAREGTAALLARFTQHRIGKAVQVDRLNVAKLAPPNGGLQRSSLAALPGGWARLLRWVKHLVAPSSHSRRR